MFETLLIILILFIAWFWVDTITKREKAVQIGRELAQRFQLQLLDDTVSCSKVWLGRNTRGHVQLLRIYEFEVSADSKSRLSCQLELLGSQLQNWHIPPYFQPLH